MNTSHCTEKAKKERTAADHTCSLCGQQYNNFAFKGGYICETCLTSIKKEDTPKTPKNASPPA